MMQSDSCGKLMKLISDEMRKNANNAMRSQDMTMSQFGALLELNQAEITERTGAESPCSAIHCGRHYQPPGAERVCGSVWRCCGPAYQAGSDHTCGM